MKKLLITLTLFVFGSLSAVTQAEEFKGASGSIKVDTTSMYTAKVSVNWAGKTDDFSECSNLFTSTDGPHAQMINCSNAEGKVISITIIGKIAYLLRSELVKGVIKYYAGSIGAFNKED